MHPPTDNTKGTLTDMQTINRDRLHELLNGDTKPRLVMTLGSRRYAQAHIPGSETFDSLDAALAELEPSEDIILYCTGGRCPSVTWASRTLIALGYQRVWVYEGGLGDWHAAQLPLAGSLYSQDSVAA